MRSRTLVLVTLISIVGGGLLGQTAEFRGLSLNCQGVTAGYTLFAPMSSETTYLVDADGKVVRTWKSAYLPSAWVYFLDNGHVLRGGSDRGSSPFGGGGQGGRFQEFDLDGNLVWDFQYNTPQLPHHDVAVLPNGNILAIAWEGKTAEEARRAGRRPASIPSNGVWPDMVIEFEPLRPSGARIVWEWHIWDHLIQNIDPALENYGDPATRPERIHINADTGGIGFSRDVFHTNAIAYNPELDQIILSVPTFNEVWVIDHSTTTLQAAGRSGGRSGKGGDLLYRWGNPQAYGRGTLADQLLGFQHDARWIPKGRPGAGHMMVFSNRTPTANGPVTKVYEFAPAIDAEGRYAVPDNGPFGPAAPLWTYSDADLQTTNLSGAERLENGNTLISAGPQGRIFELTSAGDIVWEYWSPYSGPSGNSGGAFSLFRAVKIPADHPALAGKDLRPLNPQPPASPAALLSPAPTGPCPVPPSPTLTDIQPSWGVQGTSVSLTMTGTGFISPAVSVSGSGITVSDVHSVTESSLSATLTLDSGAAPGNREITATTAGGTSTSLIFTVLPPAPTLTSITPGVGARGTGTAFDATLKGTNFVPGLTVQAGNEISVSDLQVLDATTATLRLTVAPGASAGITELRVSTPGGTSGTVPLQIAEPFPDLAISSSHSGTFGAGFDETYGIVIRNNGAAPTTGPIVVTDPLPAGIAFSSGAGQGWVCSASGRNVTCSSSTPLGPGDSSSYTLTVAVNSDAASSLRHSVSVTTEGDLNTGNNSAVDVTAVATASPVFVFTPYPLGAAQQATVDVTMPTPFPHEVTGTVVLAFMSSVEVDDPAIQFSSGGRTATFVIPANSSEARFSAQSTAGPLAFQTGTVAGTLTFSGTFTAGRIAGNFSPAKVDGLAIPMRSISIQKIQTTREGGLNVSLLLFSTAREVTSVNLLFNTTPKVVLSCGTTPGCSVSGNTLTLDVSLMFGRWFGGNSGFGGLAQLLLPLSIQGGQVTGTVGVTLKNRHGESNSQSFPIP